MQCYGRVGRKVIKHGFAKDMLDLNFRKDCRAVGNTLVADGKG